MYLKILIILSFSFIERINCATVEVSTDGPGVLDIPLIFKAKLVGDVSMEVNQFCYVFEDRGIYPRHREELISDREVNYTITYKSSEVNTGTYAMKVQVYAYIWGFKAWLITEAVHEFLLQNSLDVSLNISQTNVSEKALKHSIVSANRSALLSAHITDGSKFLTNASISYTWVVDSRTFGPFSSPDLNYTFTANKSYKIEAMVMCNITEFETNTTKFGKLSQIITAKNEIKELNVNGNTWLVDGALLRLQVNCTGGDPPFYYCYEFSKMKPNNTCSKELNKVDHCNFPITHYFPKNGTHYIEIGVYNDLNFKHKTISVNVYDIVRQTQLSFVIIPIVSSILAIIIVVVGIAYHLQQRQRYNITLEVADFDFQHNENLMEKTFFERLRESFATALRDTVFYPCTPCTRAQNYEDLIDDTVPDERNHRNNNSPITSINTNPVSYGIK